MLYYVRKLVNISLLLMYRILYKIVQTDKKTVLFMSFHGRSFSDNPRALYQEMKQQDRFSDFSYVWVVRDASMRIEGAKTVKFGSLAFFYYLAKSRYWIFNCKTYPFMIRKKDQVYLQTWHGTPLKRLAHDIQISSDAKFYRSGLNAQEMQSTYDDDVKKYTYMIAPNSFCTRVFQSAFGIEKERLIETGYPRNDILINADEQKKQEIRARLGIPEGKKVLLYAPTWRDNSFVAAGYTFELQADFRKWKEMLADEYVLLFKPHYLIINKFSDTEELNGFLYNVDASSEISDLYLIADVLVTDYSSVFFDYAILGRPIYFYMYDLDSYREELRGFYIDIYSDLPGDIYEDEEMMLKDIREGNFDRERLSQFNARFNEHEDGHASQRVIDIVFGEERS